MKRIWIVILFFAVVFVDAAVVLQKVDLRNNVLRLYFDKPYSKSRIKYFRLKKPYREVFDLPGVVLASSKVGKNLYYRACRRIDISQFDKKTVRIVIEMPKPYRCSLYAASSSNRHYRISLPKFERKYKRTHVVSKKKPRAFLSDSHYGGKELIVIDAGHGGHDTGAIGGGKREKDLVLQIAKRVERRLKKMGYRVYMTRRTDRFLELRQRTRIADRKNADIFVSIHANSVPKRKRNVAHGVETYFLQKSRDAKSQRIAARENAAVLKGAKDSLSKKIIIDSVLNGPKIIESNKLALDVQSRIIANLRARYRGVKDGGVRPAPFWVLVGASRPSILVEVGYISNPRERKRLFTPDYQERIAKGIAEGIRRYLYNHKKELGF